MDHHGFFYDGYSTTAHKIKLRGQGEFLVIENVSGGCLQTWQIDDIVMEDRGGGHRPLILKSANNNHARLKIEDEGIQDWLLANLPQLMTVNSRKKEFIFAVKLSAGVLVAIVLLYMSLPFVVRHVVMMLPHDFQVTTFKNIEPALIRRFGKRECVYDQTIGILQDMVNDFSGHDRYRVRVVKQSKINAFALPSNTIVLTSGFLDAAQSGAEIAGVLAHEIGHLEKRHITRNYLNSQAIDFVFSLFGLGMAADIGGQLTFLSYSREYEREADEFAANLLQARGIAMTGLVAFFERLNKTEGTGHGAMAMLSTHPVTQERIAYFKSFPDGKEPFDLPQKAALKKACVSNKRL